MRDLLARHGAPASRICTLHALARRILVDLDRCSEPFDLETRIPRCTEVLQSGQAPAWVKNLTVIAVDEA